MEISTIGLDLAKNVFQVHGVDALGTAVVRKALRRSQMLAFFEQGRHDQPDAPPPSGGCEVHDCDNDENLVDKQVGRLLSGEGQLGAGLELLSGKAPMRLERPIGRTINW